MARQQQTKSTSRDLQRDRAQTRSPPLPLLGSNAPPTSLNTPNPHSLHSVPALINSVPSSTVASPIPEPPDTPPPLAHAYRPPHIPESVSGHSSNRSSPEASCSPYATANLSLHSSARSSHSPEVGYTRDASGSAYQHNMNNVHTQPLWNVSGSDRQNYDKGHTSSQGATYGYSHAEHAHSPSSAVNQQRSQPHVAQPMSPQSPYTYSGQYGLQASATQSSTGSAHVMSGECPGDRLQTLGSLFLSLHRRIVYATLEHCLSRSVTSSHPDVRDISGAANIV